jgi:DNA adenine methylase
MGSAQLFFHLDTDRAILSDTNYHLVEVFNQIKKNPYPIFIILRDMPISAKAYYRIRALEPAKLGINQRAARFLYLNRLCFNGLYRTNLQGNFNVPFSGESPELIIEYSLLKNASWKLQAAKIVQGDFENIIFKNVRKGDFVYLDPPYAIENVRIFRQYGPQTFGRFDLVRLKELLDVIHCRGAHFLLSYAHSDEAKSLFSKWHSDETSTTRNISGFAKYRRREKELLITNIY